MDAAARTLRPLPSSAVVLTSVEVGAWPEHCSFPRPPGLAPPIGGGVVTAYLTGVLWEGELDDVMKSSEENQVSV